MEKISEVYMLIVMLMLSDISLLVFSLIVCIKLKNPGSNRNHDESFFFSFYISIESTF